MGPEARAHLTEVRDAASRASLLVADLLLVGQRGPLSPRLLDLTDTDHASCSHAEGARRRGHRNQARPRAGSPRGHGGRGADRQARRAFLPNGRGKRCPGAAPSPSAPRKSAANGEERDGPFLPRHRQPPSGSPLLTPVRALPAGGERRQGPRPRAVDRARHRHADRRGHRGGGRAGRGNRVHHHVPGPRRGPRGLPFRPEPRAPRAGRRRRIRARRRPPRAPGRPS